MVDRENPWPVITRLDILHATLEHVFKRHRVGTRFPNHRAPEGSPTWGELHAAILRLGPNYEPNLDAIDELTGVPAWTHPQCDECNRLVDKVIVLGTYPPDYDFSTIEICLECLMDAAEKLENPPKENTQAS